MGYAYPPLVDQGRASKFAYQVIPVITRPFEALGTLHFCRTACVELRMMLIVIIAADEVDDGSAQKSGLDLCST